MKIIREILTTEINYLVEAVEKLMFFFSLSQVFLFLLFCDNEKTINLLNMYYSIASIEDILPPNSKNFRN